MAGLGGVETANLGRELAGELSSLCTGQGRSGMPRRIDAQGPAMPDHAQRRGPTERQPMTAQSNADTLITIFGGSGFLGRHVVRALAKREYRIRVAVRRPDLAGHLQPLGRVGQINAVQANVRHRPSVAAAVRGSDVVINLVGILFESGRQRFETVQGFGAESVALAAASEDARMIHISAIGADEHSPSAYARSKAEGERLVL